MANDLGATRQVVKCRLALKWTNETAKTLA